jgi:hypothetical protein
VISGKNHLFSPEKDNGVGLKVANLQDVEYL